MPINLDDMLIPNLEDILGTDDDGGNDDLLFLMLNIAFAAPSSVKWGYSADTVEFDVDVTDNPTNEALIATVTNNVGVVTTMLYTHPDQVDVTFPSAPTGDPKLYVQIVDPSSNLSFRHGALPNNTLSVSVDSSPSFTFDLSSLGPITSESAVRVVVYDDDSFMSGELRFLYP